MTKANMPSNVARFERLMYLSLGIGMISLTLDWNRAIAAAHTLGFSTGFVFSLVGFFLVFMVLLIWLAARRRKSWARWLLLFVFILSTHGYLENLILILRIHGPRGTLAIAAQALAQLVALIFIFTGNARDWFKQQTPGVNCTEQSALP